MPTTFTTFNDGDIIDDEHIKQLMQPLQNLESGASLYRGSDTGSANAHKVSFATGNQISAYAAGQVIYFKAANANTGAATLQVTGPGGDLAAKPITKNGGTTLASGDIQAGQIVAVIYNDQGGGRFEMLNVPSGITGTVGLNQGGTGADLSGSTGVGQFLKKTSSTQVGLSAIDAGDIQSGSLSLARGGTGADLSGASGVGQFLKKTSSSLVALSALDAADVASGTLPIARGGTGLGSVSKGELLVGKADGTLEKLAVGTNGQVLSADSGQTSGLAWTAPAGSPQIDHLWGTTLSSQTFNTTTYSSVTGASATIARRSAGGDLYVMAQISGKPVSGSGVNLGYWRLKVGTSYTSMEIPFRSGSSLDETSDSCFFFKVPSASVPSGNFTIQIEARAFTSNTWQVDNQCTSSAIAVQF